MRPNPRRGLRRRVQELTDYAALEKAAHRTVHGRACLRAAYTCSARCRATGASNPGRHRGVRVAAPGRGAGRRVLRGLPGVHRARSHYCPAGIVALYYRSYNSYHVHEENRYLFV
jgi:hypothetical protein